jgi:two-component system chemotaxis response regulator CheY
MPQASKLDVVVVDDQRAMRGLVHSSLVELGIRVVRECADGVEAMRELHMRRAHLVISDLNMPRMDGLALLRAVREDRVLGATAFILLTSRGEVELVKLAIALGVNNYLRKPFAVGELKRKIEAVVGPLT